MVSGLDTVLNYNTADGSATSGGDYIAEADTVTIAAGETTVSISVTVNGDTTFEADEVFTVTIAAATNAVIASLDSATFTINNDDTPTAQPDTYTAIEDVELVVPSAVGVLANDDTASGPIITAILATSVDPSVGQLTLQPDGSFTFMPNQDSTATAIFTYKVSAVFGGGRIFESTETTVTIDVAPVNDAPVANDDLLLAVPNSITTANILANDTDVDNDTLFVVNAGSIDASILVPFVAGVSLSVTSTGDLMYNPGSSNTGQSFTYTVSDGNGGTDVATVTFFQGPTFFVDVLTPNVDEDSSTIEVKVRLVNATGAPSTVQLSISAANSTAILGFDVGGIPGAGPDGKLTIVLGPAGSAVSTVIQVTVLNDTATPIREGPETVTFVLSDPGSALGDHIPLIAKESDVATIDDPQDIPVLSIADVTIAESTGVATLTVTLTGRTIFSTLFDFEAAPTISSPAAKSPDDFEAGTGFGSFPASVSTDAVTTEIVVAILDDDIDEFDEIFLVTLLTATEGSGSPQEAVPVDPNNNVAVVTIVDDDDPPTLEIIAPADVLESAGSTIVEVRLNGASSAGVAVNFATFDGAATASSDYIPNAGTLTWEADETGFRTFIVAIIDDAIEEDGETVILTLSNPSTITASPSAPGVTIAAGTVKLLILDDEPAAAIVTIMGDGEAMPGDGYFLIVAGSNSPALGLSGTPSAQLTSPMNQTLMPISNIAEVIRKMLGLDTLRSKAVTHAWYAMTDASGGQQSIPYDVTLLYDGNNHNVSATLNMVTARTNRNFWIQDGTNFVGLGLVPDDPSIANLLTQPVNNANAAFAAALSRQVTLADVIQTIFAFSFTDNAFFSSYNTADPISGLDFADTLTQLEPFQGMIIMSRDHVTPNNGSGIDVFETVSVNEINISVPIKINIQGSFLDIVGNIPPLPVTQQLRIGFNLIAPHVWAPTPFDTAFGGTGGFALNEVYSSAISFQRSVFPVSVSPSVVGALVVQQFVTVSPSIPPFVAPGTIDPILSYWLRVADLSWAPDATPPVITASGPDNGVQP